MFYFLCWLVFEKNMQPRGRVEDVEVGDLWRGFLGVAGYVSGLETFGSQLNLQSLDLLYASCGLSLKKHPPGDSSRDLFWDGE